MQQDSSIIDFFAGNLLLISTLGLLIFVYLVLLIRKRSKEDFLHRAEKK